MNVAAFIIVLVSGIISILQMGCVTLLDTAMSTVDKNAEPVAAEAFLCFVAAVVAMIGSSLSLRSSSAGWKTLYAATILNLLGGLSSHEYVDAYFWALVYGLATGSAFFDTRKRDIET